MKQIPSAAREVLAFWFLEIDPACWFQGSDAVDEAIAARFAGPVAAARSGQLDDWADTPRGLLALVILLDQFTRNIHRGTGEAYASDAKAQQLTLRALERGDLAHLTLCERQFLLMPLMHAEDRALQRQSVALFEQLAKDAQGPLDFARHHAEIIERFGRFPYRNQELGRETTDEERAWIAEHGNPFG